jgi:hypothetical protein
VTLQAGRVAALATVLSLVAVAAAHAQDPPCRFICGLALKAEPTFTVENLAQRHRVVNADGVTERAERDWILETILALELETKIPRLALVAEMIASPTHAENDVELEFETNVYWLTDGMSRGWLTSHFDVVDQFSPAGRPTATTSYTHKLDFELDTAVHPFKSLPEGRWLKGLEFETSLDYLATGIPKAGDVFPDGTRYLDDASGWSFSFVIVIPVAPF